MILFIMLMAGCTRTGQVQAPSPDASLAPDPLITPTEPQERATRAINLDCTDDAKFIQDLTVPDGSQIISGEQVVKRWSVENSGSCDWGVGYRLIPQGSNPFVDGRESALYPARAGSEAIWSVSFQAPVEPGEYIGSWQAFNPQGQPFGDPVFALIEVVADQTEAATDP